MNYEQHKIFLLGGDSEMSKEIKCRNCGELFVFRDSEMLNRYDRKREPRYCPVCGRLYHKKREREQKRIEDERWQNKKRIDSEAFNKELEKWRVISVDEIAVDNPDETLYVIGNGFDLMHGAKSSYYDFNRTIGKCSQLRFYLENYLDVDDLWADFEGALAKIIVEMMCSPQIINMFLEDMEAFDDDAGMAEFYCAAEMAAAPVESFSTDLKKRFSDWIRGLETNTGDRPLTNIIRPGGKILNFNYTEFTEQLYGIPEKDICYIHGCRKKRKGYPLEELVLGHMPGASDEQYDFKDSYAGIPRSHTQMVYNAQETALRFVADADNELTKNCQSIIEKHKEFFESLTGIRQVITIGHSLYPVDWDYFSELIDKSDNGTDITWYFGCHSVYDLERIKDFAGHFGIMDEQVFIFRTDKIRTNPLHVTDAKYNERAPQRKCIGDSGDRAWKIYRQGLKVSIESTVDAGYVFTWVFPAEVNGAIFDSSNTRVLIVVRGINKGIFLICYTDEKWRFITELEEIPNQGVINRRLKRIYEDDESVIFVYNNRIRKYSLLDGRLLLNTNVKNAPDKYHNGTDITDEFMKIYRGDFY